MEGAPAVPGAGRPSPRRFHRRVSCLPGRGPRSHRASACRGLAPLRVKTPEMARKTLRMICLAYNLIKTLQIEAAQSGSVLVTEIGFKGTLDVIGEFRSGFHGLQNRPRLLIRRMLLVSQRLVERLVIPRPGRREPRAVKRRPKPHQYLTSHRSVFRELLHRSHYRVAA